MGQYHYLVNLDKHEFLHPHVLGSGLKAWEQFAAHPGTAAPLIALLCCSNGRGGGDFFIDRRSGKTHSFHDCNYEPDHGEGDERIVGRWAGDRIALVGDYAEDGDLPNPDDHAGSIYTRCVSAEYECEEATAAEEYAPGLPTFRDITPMVVPFVERHLGGHFEGDGWRRWVDGDKA